VRFQHHSALQLAEILFGMTLSLLILFKPKLIAKMRQPEVSTEALPLFGFAGIVICVLGFLDWLRS
jgi:hypothetical protein